MIQSICLPLVSKYIAFLLFINGSYFQSDLCCLVYTSFTYESSPQTAGSSSFQWVVTAEGLWNSPVESFKSLFLRLLPASPPLESQPC